MTMAEIAAAERWIGAVPDSLVVGWYKIQVIRKALGRDDMFESEVRSVFLWLLLCAVLVSACRTEESYSKLRLEIFVTAYQDAGFIFAQLSRLAQV